MVTARARFSLYFGALYVGFGAYLLYMPVWYEARGLSPTLIGAATACALGGRVVAMALGSLWYDRARRRRTVIFVFAATALLAFLLHIPANSPYAILPLAALAGGAFNGATPLADAFAMAAGKAAGFSFSFVRGLGSAAFIVGNLGAGALIALIGGEAVLIWLIGGTSLACLAALALPPGARAAKTQAPAARGEWSALAAGGLPLALAASGLIQSSHGFYYAFSALAWKAQGLSEAWAGVLWAIGVSAEIVLFIYTPRLFRGWNPGAMLALGGAASLIRWAILATAPPLWALVPLQLLHAFSFGVSYMGFIRFAFDAAPDHLAGRVQALNAALAGGLLLGVATSASGLVYERFETAGYLAMAVPAGLGLVFALILRSRMRPRPG